MVIQAWIYYSNFLWRESIPRNRLVLVVCINCVRFRCIRFENMHMLAKRMGWHPYVHFSIAGDTSQDGGMVVRNVYVGSVFGYVNYPLCQYFFLHMDDCANTSSFFSFLKRTITYHLLFETCNSFYFIRLLS